MVKVVSDASVVVKWFIQEKESEKALKLRDMHVSGQLDIAAPELLFFEVLNALKSSRLFSEEELKTAANSLLNYRVELHPLNKQLAEKTVEIAVQTNLTIYDAAYVALAVDLDTVLYTADGKIVETAGEKYSGRVLHVS
ncbi:MAG: type II toxin-antitoxin system VapC family toxin, partial [Candidatus Brockarchaeota archaeon]|nr:type II toxin-antitoxin system VapC family toxin [Candidatus Brockarchaeota archaeon]